MIASFRAGLTILLFLSGPGRAGEIQQLRFDHFSSEQGLSQNSVLSIVQDNQGFMWFGTQHGLNKFDGYGFDIYKQEPFDTGSLSHSMITNLFTQSDGTLWVCSNGNQWNRLVRKDGRFIRLPADPENPNTPSLPGFTAIDEDAEGRVWIGYASGLLDRYDPKTGTFEALRLPTGKSSQAPISDMLLDSKGRFWIATCGNGLFLYNGDSEGFTRFSRDPQDPTSLANNWIGNLRGRAEALYEDLSGDLWLGTAKGFSRRNGETGVFTNYPVRIGGRARPGSGLLKIDSDGRGSIWAFHAEGSISRLEVSTNSVHRYRHDPNDPNSPISLQYQDHVIDREGVLWLISQDKGLCYYQPENDQFVRPAHNPSDSSSLGTNRLLSIYEDRGGSIWIGGATTGVSKYSPSKQKFRHYLPNKSSKGDPVGNIIWSIMGARDDTLWMGVENLGVMVLEKDRTTVRTIYRQGDPSIGELDGHLVHALFEDRDGDIWIGTEISRGNRLPRGLYRLNRETGKITDLGANTGVLVFSQNKDTGSIYFGTSRAGLLSIDPKSLRITPLLEKVGGAPVQQVKDILQEKNGIIWLATQQRGLVRFDTQTGSAKSFEHRPNDRSSISRNSVMDLHIDSQGTFWVATFGGGLSIFDRQTETFSHLTRTDGLANNVVYGIIEDQGELWCSTNAGLSRYDPATTTFKNYTTSDGLQNDEFNQSSFFKTVEGELVFGGVNGFNAFYPHELDISSPPPPLTISVVVNTDRVIADELAPGAKIHLGPGDRVIEFEVAALDFTDTKRNQYHFKLDGFDPQWREAGVRRRVSYTNLNEGTYSFHVKGANSDGVFNERTVEISVAPIFYRTTWFKVVVLLSLTALFIWLLIAQRQRHLNRSREALLARDLARKSEELEFARNIQLAMLPGDHLVHSRFEIAGHMSTASEVGGDYYDFFELENGKICIAYGDATGHGVAAGLVVGMVKMAATIWTLRPETSLPDMIRDLNKSLKRSLPVKGMGMCFGIALFDPKSGKVEVCSSGMPYPCLYEKKTGILKPLALKGTPLGFVDDILVPSAHFTLSPGDILVLLSDGLSERFNPENRLWGDKALTKELAEVCARAEDTQSVGIQLLEACDHFAQKRPNDDDMTVVVLRMLPATEKGVQDREALVMSQTRN